MEMEERGVKDQEVVKKCPLLRTLNKRTDWRARLRTQLSRGPHVLRRRLDIRPALALTHFPPIRAQRQLIWLLYLPHALLGGRFMHSCCSAWKISPRAWAWTYFSLFSMIPALFFYLIWRETRWLSRYSQHLKVYAAKWDPPLELL